MSVRLDFKRDERDENKKYDDEYYQRMVGIFLSSVAITLFMLPIIMIVFTFKEEEGCSVLGYQASSLVTNVIFTIIHANSSKVIHNIILISIQVLINLSLLIHIIVTCQ